MPDVKRHKDLKGLPVNLPTGRKSYCLPLPDDPEYLALYMGQIAKLGNQSIYDRDEQHKAKDVAAIWREVANDHIQIIVADEDCGGDTEEGCCDQYLPEQDWISYNPNDPFASPNYVPPGYYLPPFYANPLIALPGLLPTDAMVNQLSFPIGQNAAQLFETGIPRARINFQGAGDVEVEIVKVVSGGFILLIVDDDLQQAKVVNANVIDAMAFLNLEDWLGMVLEGFVIQEEVVEFNIETPGQHKIDVYFMPYVSLDEHVLGWGGGIRSIEFCNGTQPGDTMPPSMQVIDGEPGCKIIQWRPNSAAAWIDLTTVCDGAPGEDAPPVHMGFDAASCSIKYTQGDINSPYSGEGSEWITIFDWNITDLKECLGITGNPILPPLVGFDPDRCKIAWGIATYFQADMLELYDHHLELGDTYIGLGVIGDMLLEGGHWFGWNWLFGLSNVVNAWGNPTIGNRDVLAAPDTLCKIAEVIYNAITITDGETEIDRDLLQSGAEDIDTFVTAINDAINRWMIELTNEIPSSRFSTYLQQAALFETDETCIDFNCVTSTCVNYEDTFTGGLGAQTSLVTGWGDWNSGNGHAAVGCIASTVGTGFRDAGCEVDLGEPCTVTQVSAWGRSSNDAGSWAMYVYYYDGDHVELGNLSTGLVSVNRSTWQLRVSISEKTNCRYVRILIETNGGSRAYCDDIQVTVET